jgi:hypothetical protein
MVQFHFEYWQEQLSYYWKILCLNTSLFFEWLIPGQSKPDRYCSRCGDEIKKVCSCNRNTYEPPSLQIIVEQPQEVSEETSMITREPTMITREPSMITREPSPTISKSVQTSLTSSPSFDSDDWEKLSDHSE